MRKIKVLKFTLKHNLNDVEEEVNKAIEELHANGNKVVSITHYIVQTNLVQIIYNIIYDCKEPSGSLEPSVPKEEKKGE